ncbi:MAG: TULIP family P47-like protein, partial [Phenylobacterium sp.]
MSDAKTSEQNPPPVSAGAPDITTAGWDTVFALRLSHVNELLAAAIRAGDLVLPRIDWSDPSGGQFSISAPLVGFAFVGDPSLSGSQTKVKISVGPGTLEYEGTYQTSAADVFGQLDLRRIDDPKFVSISAQPATDFFPSRVANLTLTDAQQKATTGADLQEAYKSAFQQGVETNLKAFQPVLAKIDLQSALRQSARWLAPVAVGHCVAGGVDASGNADNGTALAILCMTDPFVPGNPLPPPSFDGRLIPKDAKAAFLISGPKFNRNLLFAGLAQALYSPGKPLTPDQLAQIEKDRLQITGQDASQVISMKPGSPAIPLRTVQVDVSPLYAV